MPNSLWPHEQEPARLLCPWGFSRQEYWSGLPCPPPGNLFNPGIKPKSPALQADSLPSEPPERPKNTGAVSLSLLQGIFLTQESNQGLLHCRYILYQLSYQESPVLCLPDLKIFSVIKKWYATLHMPCRFFLGLNINITLSQQHLVIPKFSRVTFSKKDCWCILCCCLITKLSDSWDPMDYNLPGFFIHGIFQARIPEWVVISFSRESSWPRDGICMSCIAGIVFTIEPPGKLIYFVRT